MTIDPDILNAILDDRRFVADLLVGGLETDLIDTDATARNERATEEASR